MPKLIEVASKIQIHTGIHITRRKQLNVVTNEDGEPLWTGASIFQACRYCIENDHKTVTMHHEGERIAVILGEVVP